MANKCVYIHRRDDTGDVFYVGIGNYDRPYRSKNRNNLWHKIANKTSYSIEVLYDRLKWDAACEIESFLISLYGRIVLGTGKLANIGDGGEGRPCPIVSKETREKMSKSRKGLKPWNYGVKGYSIGIRTKETRNKMRKSALGKNNKIILDMRTGIFWSSLNEASKISGLTISCLSRQLNGERKNKTTLIYV